MVEQSSTFLGPWWSALLVSGSGRGFDRALGAAVTIGLSVTLVRFAAQVLQAGRESSVVGSMVAVMRKRILTSGQPELEDEELQQVVMHRGHCHCEAIEFELLAPKLLRATISSRRGEIQYPFVNTEAANFKLVRGSDELTIYYVSVPAVTKSPGGTATVAAHSFCKQCGVHVLQAPDSHTNSLRVNINCLPQSTRVSEQQSNSCTLSAGVPVAGQWTTSEATIPESYPFDAASQPLTDDNVSHAYDDDAPFAPIHMVGPAVNETKIFPRTEQNRTGNPEGIMYNPPGTPSTIATTYTESDLGLQAQQRQLKPSYPSWNTDNRGVAGDDIVSLSGASITSAPAVLRHRRPPRGYGSRSGGSAFVPSSSSALDDSASSSTPVIPRANQLKYYMSKYQGKKGQPTRR